MASWEVDNYFQPGIKAARNKLNVLVPGVFPCGRARFSLVNPQLDPRSPLPFKSTSVSLDHIFNGNIF